MPTVVDANHQRADQCEERGLRSHVGTGCANYYVLHNQGVRSDT